MGYYMSQVDSKFRIKAENKAAALAAIKALSDPAIMAKKAGGGSWGAGGYIKKWYSWVDTDEFANAASLEDALDAWGWEAEDAVLSGWDGVDIVDIRHAGEKLGDDLVLFDAIAPFVESGSYIHMCGEDGTNWRWYFDGKTCVEQPGGIVFYDPEGFPIDL